MLSAVIACSPVIASAILKLNEHMVEVILDSDGHYEVYENLGGGPTAVAPKFTAELLEPRKISALKIGEKW